MIKRKDPVSRKSIKVECESCFEEEGSWACVRPSHKAEVTEMSKLRLVETVHFNCEPDYEYKGNAHNDSPLILAHVNKGRSDEHWVIQVCTCECHKEVLGMLVREAWVNWAEKHPSPKPVWLIPYEKLPECDKEADRIIGKKLLRAFLGWLVHP